MATPQIPDSEPAEITIGETIKWRKTVTDYSPADGWALKYYLRGPGAGLDLTEDDCITPDGDTWLITIPAHETGNPPPPLPPATDQLSAGNYYFESWVEKDDEKYQLEPARRVTVKQSLASIATDETYDGRSEVKKTLDAIRAAIGKRATAAQLSRDVFGTRIEFMSMTELLVAESRFQQLYNQEVRANRLRKGAPFLRNIHTRFVPNR